MDHTVLTLPHGAPGHIWVNFWDILRYKPRFSLTLTCCCSGRVLSNFNPAALQAVLLHLNLETLLCWKVAMLGEGRCPSLLSFSK